MPARTNMPYAILPGRLGDWSLMPISQLDYSNLVYMQHQETSIGSECVAPVLTGQSHYCTAMLHCYCES